jgi:molybdopterin-synthase adenylyltransferase
VTDGFRYEEMVGRNAGFLRPDDQQRLRQAPIFVCGVGGMGGGALQALARAGVERVTISDFDRFEVSNLNRQVFATLSTLGLPKTEAVARALREINPQIMLDVQGREWTTDLDRILASHKVVINGMDDAPAGIHLYRRARVHGATVIDAFTSPLPSVYVVRPDDPRPEEWLGFPTPGTPWDRLSAEQLEACKLAEAMHVMVHSSSARHIDMAIAGEFMSGRRARPSFAPVVLIAGNLMAFEAVRVVLGWPRGADYRGVFLNPWTLTIERPRPWWVAAVLRPVVRRRLEALAAHG